MAKRKSSGKHYVSKGERQNVSQKTLNMMRRDRERSVDADEMSRQMMSPDKKRIIQEAERLYFEFGDKVTWAACVQAVKTGYVSEFRGKYYDAPRTKQKRKKPVTVVKKGNLK